MALPHSTRPRPAQADAGATPQRPVVVYDAACSFCRSQVERIRRMDQHGALDFAPRQSPGLADRFPALAHGDFESGMRLVVPRPARSAAAEVFVGADAVYQIARRLPSSRWLAWLYRVPGIHAAARRAYAWVAAHRRALGPPCEEDACAPAPPASHPVPRRQR